MNVRELRYLAELVKRDGDDTLQARHGILSKASLYQKLHGIAEKAEKQTCGATQFAVYKDAEIGDVKEL